MSASPVLQSKLPPPLPASVGTAPLSPLSTPKYSPDSSLPSSPTSKSLASSGSPAAACRPASQRLVDYFAVFGRGEPILTAESLLERPTVQQMRFQSILLPQQRYPLTDYPDSALSGNTHNFCFPEHIRLLPVSLRDISDAYSSSFLSRRPRLHRFTLTKLDGSKQYCVALTVWERMSEAEVDHMYEQVETKVRKMKEGDTTFDIASFSSALRAVTSSTFIPTALYTPKALTLVSSWPFCALWEEMLRNLWLVAACGCTESTLRKLARPTTVGAFGSGGEAAGASGSSKGSLNRAKTVLPNGTGTLNGSPSSPPPSLEEDPSRFSLVRLRLPLERILTNLLFELPLPPPGLLQVSWRPPCASALVMSGVVKVARPPLNQLPLCDVDWPLVFRCVDHVTLIGIFVAVATEQKVILVSAYRNLITAVCDAITVLLFPFAWAGVYMPLLPSPMLEFLYAPVPFLAGISTEMYQEHQDEMPDEVVTVELDQGRIRLPNADALPQLPESLYSKLLHQLKQHASIYAPSHPLVKLSDQAFPFGQDLHPPEVNEEYAASSSTAGDGITSPSGATSPSTNHVHSSLVPQAYQALSTAFEPVQTYRPIQRRASFPPGGRHGVNGSGVSAPLKMAESDLALAALAISTAADESQLHVEEVRYGFLRLWCKLFAKYDKYMPWGEHATSKTSPPASPGRSAFQSDEKLEWFNTGGFLAAAPRDARPFLQMFLATQLFAKFVDDRILLRDDLEEWRKRKAECGSHSSGSGSGHPITPSSLASRTHPSSPLSSAGHPYHLSRTVQPAPRHGVMSDDEEMEDSDFEHSLQPLLELTPEFGPGNHARQVQRHHALVLQ